MAMATGRRRETAENDSRYRSGGVDDDDDDERDDRYDEYYDRDGYGAAPSGYTPRPRDGIRSPSTSRPQSADWVVRGGREWTSTLTPTRTTGGRYPTWSWEGSESAGPVRIGPRPGRKSSRIVRRGR